MVRPSSLVCRQEAVARAFENFQMIMQESSKDLNSAFMLQGTCHRATNTKTFLPSIFRL